MPSALQSHGMSEVSSNHEGLRSELGDATLLSDEQAIRGRVLVLYDGLCGLCNRVVRLLLRYDHADRLRYAPLDSALARAMLSRYPSLPQTPEQAQSVVVMTNCLTSRESVYQRSDAVLAGMRQLSTPWAAIAVVFSLIPRILRDFGYRIVARVRYRLAGRYETCPVPTSAERSRILSIDAG